MEEARASELGSRSRSLQEIDRLLVQALRVAAVGEQCARTSKQPERKLASACRGPISEPLERRGSSFAVVTAHGGFDQVGQHLGSERERVLLGDAERGC